MSDMTFPQSAPKTDLEYEAEFAALLQEMSRIDARMQSDHTDIEHLRAESQQISARTDAMLDELEKQLDKLRRKV